LAVEKTPRAAPLSIPPNTVIPTFGDKDIVLESSWACCKTVAAVSLFEYDEESNPREKTLSSPVKNNAFTTSFDCRERTLAVKYDVRGTDKTFPFSWPGS
jgi:hypothetical protein